MSGPKMYMVLISEDIQYEVGELLFIQFRQGDPGPSFLSYPETEHHLLVSDHLSVEFRPESVFECEASIRTDEFGNRPDQWFLACFRYDHGCFCGFGVSFCSVFFCGTQRVSNSTLSVGAIRNIAMTPKSSEQIPITIRAMMIKTIVLMKLSMTLFFDYSLLKGWYSSRSWEKEKNNPSRQQVIGPSGERQRNLRSEGIVLWVI